MSWCLFRLRGVGHPAARFRDVSKTRSRTIDTMAIITAAANAGPRPSTSKVSMSQSVTSSMNAVMTRENRPSVSRMTGNVSSRRVVPSRSR